jgi:DNA polymerase elongation subunit (family B)
MSKFYTNVFQRGNIIYVRGYDKGISFVEKVKYKPYLFIESNKESNYNTIDGRSVSRIDFDSIYEAKEFVEAHKSIVNFPIYGMQNFMYPYIYGAFPGNISPDFSLMNIAALDIEVSGKGGYSKPEDASQPITAISLMYKQKTVLFGYFDYVPKNKKVIYVKCKDEFDLLQKFLEVWNTESWRPDILSGWNTQAYDIPYLVNRITNLFGEEQASRLSPYNIIKKNTFFEMGKEKVSYDIAGITHLDYLDLYKKFSFSNQESYKLDFIAELELGEKKISYEEYGNLTGLYEQNIELFYDYNIKDTYLIIKLEEKLGFIKEALTIAYMAKGNAEDTLGTVKVWDSIIHNYLMDKNIVVPPMKYVEPERTIPGGFVKEPRQEMIGWGVSMDMTSLYPHIYMLCNISPETLVDKVSIPDVDIILETNFKNINHGPYSLAANGVRFRKDFKGFIPQLMEEYFNFRKLHKNNMLSYKKEFEKTKDTKFENLISISHNMQLATKILLNSFYGASANPYFRWFNTDMAEAITVTGQLAIKFAAKKLNEYLNKVLKTVDIDYILVIDTDSNYLKLQPIIDALGINHLSNKEISNIIDKFCVDKLQPYLDNCFHELKENMNFYEQKLFMKRESIFNKMVITGKKHYIMNIINEEGVEYSKPKLKIVGLEAVKSSTPEIIKKKMKETFALILNSDEKTVIAHIEEFKEEFKKTPFEKIAFPRGVNNLAKYSDSAKIYGHKTPIHVRAALLYNFYLKKKKLDKDYLPIYEGDKIKFIYLKMPNPYHEDVIGCPGEFPKEFDLEKYIDYEKQFDKTYYQPVNAVLKACGWSAEKQASLLSFFGE